MKISDINCDMGEWRGCTHPGVPQTVQTTFGSDHKVDKSIMPYITSANIACGLHAGDPVSIEHTIKLAMQYGINIGAHPGFPDPENFGRKYWKLPLEELSSYLLYQIGAVKTMTETMGGRLHHVKPHGALYNAAASDYKLGQLIAGVLKSIDPDLILYGLPSSEMERAAHHEGVAFFAEVFADRAYNNDGSLLNRNLPGAVLLDPDEMIQRIIKLLDENVVVSATGERIPVKADTICIHSDNPVALPFVKKLFGIFTKD